MFSLRYRGEFSVIKIKAKIRIQTNVQFKNDSGVEAFFYFTMFYSSIDIHTKTSSSCGETML